MLTFNPITGNFDLVNSSGISQATADARYFQIGNNLSEGAAGTMRANLGLGSIATQAANSIAITGGSITGLSALSADSPTFVLDAVNHRIGFGTTTPAEKLNVIGNFQVDDNATPTKGYRFRTTGSSLDLDGSNADLLISNYSGAGFSGTQRQYMRFGASGSFVTVANGWEWKEGNNVFGTTRHSINADGGVTFNSSNADADILFKAQTYDAFFIDASNNATCLMNNSAGKLSFFGATPAVRPTGVAVTAAGVHAALVTLGLITA